MCMLIPSIFARLKCLRLLSAAAVALTLWAPVAEAETRVASWNVLRMNADNKDMGGMVRIAAHFDLLALQEVMNEEAVANLVAELKRSTKEDWGVIVSDAIGRGTYKEAYALVWRKSNVEFLDSAVVYLDDKDVFAREPLSARFQTKDGLTFILANIHVIYGDSKSDRVPEVQALRSYWQWLADTFPGEQIFLAGDFNMPPDDPSFDLLKEVALPALTSGATTLGKQNGRFVNLYDNIWFPNNLRGDLRAGILDFPAMLELSHELARDRISDHAPAYLIIDGFDETSGITLPSAIQ